MSPSFASSLGQGVFIALSVSQQDSCGHSVVFAPDNVGQKHTVQQAGQPGKEYVHVRKGGVTSSACTEARAAWETRKS